MATGVGQLRISTRIMHTVTFLVVIQVFLACPHGTDGRYLRHNTTHLNPSSIEPNEATNSFEELPDYPAVAAGSDTFMSTKHIPQEPQFNLKPVSQNYLQRKKETNTTMNTNIKGDQLGEVDSSSSKTTATENGLAKNKNSTLSSKRTASSQMTGRKKRLRKMSRSRKETMVREIPDSHKSEKFQKTVDLNSNFIHASKFTENDNEKLNKGKSHEPTVDVSNFDKSKIKPGYGEQLTNSKLQGLATSEEESIFHQKLPGKSNNNVHSLNNDKLELPQGQGNKKHKTELAKDGEGDTNEKFSPGSSSNPSSKYPNQFSPDAMLILAVKNLQKPEYFHSRPGFAMFQGSDDRTRSASSSASDWWSQDAWSGTDDTGESGSGSDLSIWFQKSAGQDSTQPNGNSNNAQGGSNNVDTSSAWLQSSNSVNSGNNQPSSGSSSSVSSSSSSSSSSGSTSNEWTGSSGGSTSGSGSNLDSFSYDLWKSVLSNQASSSSSFSSSNSFGSGTSSVNGVGSSNNGFAMPQQGGVSSSIGQAQGGGSVAGFIQGGSSTGMDSSFSFGMNAFGGTSSAGTSSSGSNGVPSSGSAGAAATATTGGSSGFGFGSSAQGFGSSGSSGVTTNDNKLTNSNANNNGMTSNINNMFSFGSSSGTGGFSMGGNGAGSGSAMGMNPGFGGSQGNTGDNTANMFFTFAQAQNAPGAKTGAGFGSSQGMGSNSGASRDSSGFWASSQGTKDNMGSGAFQFNGGMSENNNAWQFSGMTNPGFSDPGFGGSQAVGGGAGFGSSQGGSGGLQSFSGSPGFGSSQGGIGGAGFGGQEGRSGGNSFSLTNTMGGVSSGGGVSMGVASGLTNTGQANSEAVGGSTSNQGGSLSNILGNFTRGVSALSNLLDEEGAISDEKGNSGTVGSPFPLPQFLMGPDSSSSNSFAGMSSFGGGPSVGNSGPSSSSGNLFSGGGAPISGFAIGGGGQVSSPASAAQFNFGSGNSGNTNPGNVSSNGKGPTNPAGTSGFPGTGSPFSQPQNSGTPNGAPGVGGGGASAGSPFSGAAGGGSSAGSPFSSALTGKSPFGSSSSSLFSTGSGGGNPFSGSGNSNPFKLSGTDSSDPFSSSMFQTGSKGSSSSFLDQFMPQFNPNSGSSPTSTGQQTSDSFSLFSLGNNAFGNGANNNNFINSGSSGFSGFQLNSMSDEVSSVFPVSQTGVSMRNAPDSSNMALSRLIASIDSFSDNANDTGVESAEAMDSRSSLNIDTVRFHPQRRQAMATSQSSFSDFSGFIDDAFVENVIIKYCDGLIQSEKGIKQKNFVLNLKEDHNFYHESKSPKHPFSKENSKILKPQKHLIDTLFYLCNSLATVSES